MRYSSLSLVFGIVALSAVGATAFMGMGDQPQASVVTQELSADDEGPLAFTVATSAEPFPKDSHIAGGPATTIDGECPPNGDDTHPGTPHYKANVAKNNSGTPANPKEVKATKLLATPSGSSDFTTGAGAYVEGYVGDVILEVHQKTSGGQTKITSESCNCQHTAERQADDHIYLLPTAGDLATFNAPPAPGGFARPKQRVIDVEVTPRGKELAKMAGFNWDSAHLQTLKRHHVRFYGFLFDDWEHKDVSYADGVRNNPNSRSAKVQRGTCWEIHPVTRIVVLDQ